MKIYSCRVFGTCSREFAKKKTVKQRNKKKNKNKNRNKNKKNKGRKMNENRNRKNLKTKIMNEKLPLELFTSSMLKKSGL